MPQTTARRIRVRGVVQGVGFRPFVHRLAVQHGLAGWVLNDAAGVEVHAQGEAATLDAFVERIARDAPAAAAVSELSAVAAAAEPCTSFEIRESRCGPATTTRISPDLAICGECLRELRDPSDPRHGYEYINCTNCGPRYSIVESLPYDRARTTMRAWPLCSSCAAEFHDAANRRFHAQPVACPRCGPRVRLVGGGEAERSGGEAIERAVELLRRGAIVAIKGIGGYHLACDARRADVIEALRSRKYRKEKPLAVMAASLEQARRLVELMPEHERLLTSAARPIVLATARETLSGVAPENDELGVMLPYAPLHHLLFDAGAPSPLVLTSANRSSEPLAYRDEDALRELAGIADAFLVGERPIARRVEDSVVAVRGGQVQMIRRSRGYAPAVVASLPAGRPILAVGADLKNAITLVVDGQAILSQFIGDLDDAETQGEFERTIDDLLSMYSVDRRELVVAHDLHPQFCSTRVARRLGGARVVAVQHHVAHVASVAAEHDLLDQPLIGVALDGTGYGDDGTIWGGEFFVGSVFGGFEHRGGLRAVPLVGGDAAARHPVQAAAGYLSQIGALPDMRAAPFCFPGWFDQAMQLAARNVRCFQTSSTGRLFDAVAALLGFMREISFEGQAAAWVEHLARQAEGGPDLPFDGHDPRPLIGAVMKARLAGVEREAVALGFHRALALGLAERVIALHDETGISLVALSGGVFQNGVLLDELCERLGRGGGRRIVRNNIVPANDGGISLGQAAMACARLGD